MVRFFRMPGAPPTRVGAILSATERVLGRPIDKIGTEYCYYAETVDRDAVPQNGSRNGGAFSGRDLTILRYVLSETFEPEQFGNTSFLAQRFPTVLEYGPRLNFETAWSSAAVQICRRSGVDSVQRLERSVRLGLPAMLTEEQAEALIDALCDRMTEMRYRQPLTSFETGLVPQPVEVVPLATMGIEALQRFNHEYGCSWDQSDLALIASIYGRLDRDPTDVELFQIAQANSEHSRHWVFRGELWIDGVRVPEKSLMDIVRQTLKTSAPNSVIAFRDDSSAIRGRTVRLPAASQPLSPSPLVEQSMLLHPTLTAETHNFPSGVSPYPGGATGGGGRIRDNQAVGRGGLVYASGAAYCTGNLHIPDYPLPWEEDGWTHPPDLASPLEILIEASDGASDYGNRFGEPLIYGFTRTFGLRLAEGYRSWYKPVMYSVGTGQIRDEHTVKGDPEVGMLVVQVGGPAYRIGMGGGAASSMEQSGDAQELDFNAVQRGDPEMEQRLNRLMRACIELDADNPIISAHDLGAGGDCNALPEIVDPAGAVIDLRAIPVGDKTLSVLEIWGNESQERNALLIRPAGLPVLEAIAARENVPLAVVGRVTGDGQLVLVDQHDGSRPVDLPLNDILGQLPPKRFDFQRRLRQTEPLSLPPHSDFRRLLDLVLRIPTICSKRFLTNKVDVDATGLVIQRQLVGPRHLPLSDYAVIAQTYLDASGTALSLGEQPIKGLLSPGAGARMAVAEALLNMAGVVVTDLSEIKCSANWMLAAKQPGEGAWLYDAACALRSILTELGIGVDGGKDSLSMASQGIAPDGHSELVIAPPQLVIAPYALAEDVACRVTPDLKTNGNRLLLLPVSHRQRLGGSALAQVLGVLGDEAPDIEDAAALEAVFRAVQELISSGAVVSCHDVSDGGLIVALLEMAFAGDRGWKVAVTGDDPYHALFAEEAGVVIEVAAAAQLQPILDRHGVSAVELGHVTDAGTKGLVELNLNGTRLLSEPLYQLYSAWEETAYRLDRLQANPTCAEQEWQSHHLPPVTAPYRLSFDPDAEPTDSKDISKKSSSRRTGPAARPRVAILREQGSNGDREMAAAFLAAGFEPWDITTIDLLNRTVHLQDFQVAAFVGGFSFGSVLGSAKGWASVIRSHEHLSEELSRFFARPDSLSLGVCNGCQLMALLGIPGFDLPDTQRPRFVRNTSERFESRFSTVSIEPSPAVMLQGMEGSILGVWVAHGEGRLHIPDPTTLDWIVEKHLAPVRFVDPTGKPTTDYPFNPNGSPLGIAALCSPDGRHLAIMPHAERAFQLRQWPWVPPEWRCRTSPWLRLFRNAFEAVK
ncbi:MAG: phosphoribosylformylglycinamidine synthase [Actinobacteria bacterium]|nr:phosphoribosylformylglycinamidine synthase [Actinomycetota bacterium]